MPGLHDHIAGNEYLSYKSRLISDGFTVTDQVVNGNHSILFDDEHGRIAFVSPQFGGDWDYHEVTSLNHNVMAQLGNKVRYQITITTSRIDWPLGNIYIETSNPGELQFWLAKIAAHCNQGRRG